MRDAYYRRDISFFQDRIQTLAAHIADGDLSDTVLSNMHIALALHDSLHTGGETCSLIMDFVNL
jgi:hypothetical protein